jgi:transcriptional regulator with XRE-family HTH domain
LTPTAGGARRASGGGEEGMRQKRTQKIDKVIGRNIRIHRLAREMSQTELGDRLGVSFQQVQKYENGTNRVGSGRLYQIAAILGIQVDTFFKGGERAGKGGDPGLLDLLAQPQSVRLIRAFAKIRDTTVRRSLVQIAEKFAKSA